MSQLDLKSEAVYDEKPRCNTKVTYSYAGNGLAYSERLRRKLPMVRLLLYAKKAKSQ